MVSGERERLECLPYGFLWPGYTLLIRATPAESYTVNLELRFGFRDLGLGLGAVRVWVLWGLKAFESCRA